MEDDDLMPWGMHQGIKMKLVPFDYLMFFYKKQKLHGDVLIFFEKKLNELSKETNTNYLIPNYKPKKNTNLKPQIMKNI